MLEIQVRGVDRRAHESREHAVEIARAETGGAEQLAFGGLDEIGHGVVIRDW